MEEKGEKPFSQPIISNRPLLPLLGGEERRRTIHSSLAMDSSSSASFFGSGRSERNSPNEIKAHDDKKKNIKNLFFKVFVGK